jgi:ATP-dependent helicase/nuclease subunit B
MGFISAPEVDAWLRGGGIVVAASERAARAVKAAFHRARRAEGLTAWPAPQVLDWRSFARSAWADRGADGLLLLNPLQEESLWCRIIRDSGHTAGWTEPPRRRLAQLAMEAHELLCAHAPHLLRPAARSAWLQDHGAFSGWLSEFDDACRPGGLMSASRVPFELLARLDERDAGRPPLVLAGFDRLLPIQQKVFDAWGEFRSIAPGEQASAIHSYAAANEQAELSACALWCSRYLGANPSARVLVVAHDASQRRGEIERAFLKPGVGAKPLRFEFSLGVPLLDVGLARAASLLLRWLDDAIEEHEVDWLLGSGTGAANPEEAAALQSFMRGLRRKSLQRTRWTLNAFVRQRPGSAALPSAWVERMARAQKRLEATPQTQGPLEWAGLVPQLLETIGWPGRSSPASAEFQAISRWQQAVDSCGSLGFDGRTMKWSEFRSTLERTLAETLYAAESEDAPIQIAGPAESAGLSADAIWFLGADEGAWPGSGRTHPLLPIDVQRSARMPHASPQLDWELAESITARLLAAAPEITISYAQQKEGVETRPSRLVASIAGTPRPLPSELAPDAAKKPRTIVYEDRERVPVPAAPAILPAVRLKKSPAQLSLFDDGAAQPAAMQVHKMPGGSNVLTAQSQCAFKAFATTRLGAQEWDAAEAGLSASQRGKLLHAVLHAVWGGPTHRGIRTFTELQELGPGLRVFVEEHVQRVLAEELPLAAREQMQPRYLELEEKRLVRLVTEWLEYERTRVPFTVDATEEDANPTIAGLTLKLRLDRLDRLNDGSLLVIDYKSGNVAIKSWELPRPDDVQLPLYAAFGLDRERETGGLVFAKVRTGDPSFAGKVRNAVATLDGDLDGKSGLVKNPLTPEHLSEWKEAIEQLARDFLAGKADVDPRDYPATCERCGLYSLCRVKERNDEEENEDEENGWEAGDE